MDGRKDDAIQVHRMAFDGGVWAAHGYPEYLDPGRLICTEDGTPAAEGAP